MNDSSATGVLVRLTASVTFPRGITITAFPGDSDIGTTGDTEVASSEMGVNGDLIWWKTAQGVEAQVPVNPNSLDDTLLDKLYQANRVSKSKSAKKDIITLVVMNPVTGIPKTYKNGVITSGPVGYQYGGDGRIKSRVYQFIFEEAV